MISEGGGEGGGGDGDGEDGEEVRRDNVFWGRGVYLEGCGKGCIWWKYNVCSF